MGRIEQHAAADLFRFPYFERRIEFVFYFAHNPGSLAEPNEKPGACRLRPLAHVCILSPSELSMPMREAGFGRALTPAIYRAQVYERSRSRLYPAPQSSLILPPPVVR